MVSFRPNRVSISIQSDIYFKIQLCTQVFNTRDVDSKTNKFFIIFFSLKLFALLSPIDIIVRSNKKVSQMCNICETSFFVNYYRKLAIKIVFRTSTFSELLEFNIKYRVCAVSTVDVKIYFNSMHKLMQQQKPKYTFVYVHIKDHNFAKPHLFNRIDRSEPHS